MIETANKIPVPEPIAPTKSENIEISPIIIPPSAAAVGMYLLRTAIVDLSWWPAMLIPSSFNFLAMSLGDYFVTSSQNLHYQNFYLEKKAQLTIMKIM